MVSCVSCLGWRFGLDLRLHRILKRSLCQCSRVSGRTRWSASRQARLNRAKATITSRSTLLVAGRFTLRRRTMSCWRRSASSAISSLRFLVMSPAIPAVASATEVAGLSRRLRASPAMRTHPTIAFFTVEMTLANMLFSSLDDVQQRGSQPLAVTRSNMMQNL